MIEDEWSALFAKDILVNTKTVIFILDFEPKFGFSLPKYIFLLSNRLNIYSLNFVFLYGITILIGDKI